MRSYNHLIVNLTECLSNSVLKRITFSQNLCKICYFFKTFYNNVKCSHSKVGILFSGGLDCSVLANLSNQYIPYEDSIDLINVSFSKNTEAPDTTSAKEALSELKYLHSSRRWNMVFVKPNSTVKALRSIIRDLIHPRSSILDVDIGTALWFATRAEGLLNNKIYKSTARILISGSGADELFGGYKRYKKTNSIESCKAFYIFQMQLDWNRFPSRNLARDDRITSFHGVTVRKPYIEEHFCKLVKNITSLNPNFNGDMCEKIVLRTISFKLGFLINSYRPKRAIQFGAKIANNKMKGNSSFVFFNS